MKTFILSSANCKICQVEHKHTTKCDRDEIECECKDKMISIQKGNPTTYGCQGVWLSFFFNIH